MLTDPADRHAAVHDVRGTIRSVEAGQLQRDRLSPRSDGTEQRVDLAEVEVPPPGALLTETEPQRSVRYDRLAGGRVQQHGLELGMLAVLRQPGRDQVGRGEELARNVGLTP